MRGSTFDDVEARGVPYRVVAAKWPGHWIIRGIYADFYGPERVIRAVERYVDRYDPEIEWSTHVYRLSSYMAYGSGVIPEAPSWTGGWSGVFKFIHTANDIYRNAVRLGSIDGGDGA
jgi:hypothetical protein